MTDYGASACGPQLSSSVRGVKNSAGLRFKEVFSGEQISKAIAKTVPEFRDRAFPPSGDPLCFHASSPKQ